MAHSLTNGAFFPLQRRQWKVEFFTYKITLSSSASLFYFKGTLHYIFGPTRSSPTLLQSQLIGVLLSVTLLPCEGNLLTGYEDEVIAVLGRGERNIILFRLSFMEWNVIS